MLRVRTAWSGWEGGPGLSTFYFTTPTEDLAAAVRCRGYVQDLLNNGHCRFIQNNVTGLISPEVDVLTSANGVIINTLVDNTPLQSGGLGGGSLAPPAIAALLHLTTGSFIAGRRLRGRSFVSPVALEVLQSDGTLAEVPLNAANASATTILNALPAGDDLVVWHRPKFGQGGATGVVTALDFAQKLAVLRSRRD